MGEHVADADENAGGQRQLDIETVKNIDEFRHHERHEKNYEEDADSNDHDGINHGGLEFGLDVGELLEMGGHAAQHFHQGTGGFTRLDHVDIQIGKNPGLTQHRIRETAPFSDFLF